MTATAATRAGTLDPHARYVCGGRYTWFSSYQPTCYQGRAHGALDLPGSHHAVVQLLLFRGRTPCRRARAGGGGAPVRLWRKDGIELPGRSRGRVADPAARLADGGTWTGGDTIQAAIGQSENMMTPLQLAVYASTLAADGVRYAPHIGYRVTDPADGRVLYERETEIAGRVEYAGDAAQQIREGMEAVALSGAGAPYFYNYPVKVACKTGTAEVPGGSANSVMILYAPADDPQIAIAAVIEHGGLGHYSFPIAKDILNAYFGSRRRKTRCRPTSTCCPTEPPHNDTRPARRRRTRPDRPRRDRAPFAQSRAKSSVCRRADAAAAEPFPPLYPTLPAYSFRIPAVLNPTSPAPARVFPRRHGL